LGREISIFSDYRQKENSLTNYCGLLMKLLYEENPRRFQELLVSLLKDKKSIVVGPTFAQQEKFSKSIPDLTINQKSFSIFFETKTTDWFYQDQINRHIISFNSKADNKILFLLSNFEQDDLEGYFKKQIEIAKKDDVTLQPLTFSDFVESLEKVCVTEFLKNLLEEFKGYLDRNGYLPKWKYLLDVVSCSGTLDEIGMGAYICPDTGGAYSHRRAKYFGPYASKEVNSIFEISAVVILDKDFSGSRVKWNNVKVNNELLIERAKTILNLCDRRLEEIKSFPLQFFLLENRAATKFIKESSGGMMQSKKYFWDIALNCHDSKQLAEKLHKKNWGDFKNSL